MAAWVEKRLQALADEIAVLRGENAELRERLDAAQNERQDRDAPKDAADPEVAKMLAELTNGVADVRGARETQERLELQNAELLRQVREQREMID